jgi:tetratricopeptide (TPR) repeat protein
MEKSEESIEFYDKALELSPNLGLAYNNKAVTIGKKSALPIITNKEKLGRLEEAIALYLEGIQRDPDCDLLYLNLGAVYGKQNKIKESLDCVNKGDTSNAHG